MKFSDIANNLNKVVTVYLNSLGDEIDDHFDINTAIDDFSFATSSGYLCTIVRVEGSYVEDDNYASYKKRCDIIADSVASGMNKGQHLMQVNYRRSQGLAEKIYRESIRTSMERAKALGLNAQALEDSQVETFSKKMVVEDVFIALWTKSSLLDATCLSTGTDAIKEAEERMGELAKSKQALVASFDGVKSAHADFVKSILKSAESVGVKLSTLKRSESINSMIRAVSPELTEDIEIIFPDSEYFAQHKETLLPRKPTIEDSLWPSLSQQILPEDCIEMDPSAHVAMVGSTLFSTIEVSMPPRNLVLFNKLADDIDDDTPVLLSYFIDSSVSFNFFWKSTLSRFPFPSTNDRINKSIKAAEKLKLIDEPTVEYKISATTWSSDYDELKAQKTRIVNAIGKWGMARCREYKGSPMKALMSSIAGINKSSFGGSVYAPLKGVLPQLPLGRRLSVWKSSFLAFMAEGGKLFPFAPTSSPYQKYWNVAILADMGSGKSVLVQLIAWSHWLAANARGLTPLIGHVDIGFSSAETIRMLKALSDKDKKSQYLHHTLENNESNAYNIHGTELGYRRPDEDLLKMLVNFYLTLLTPAGKEAPHEDLEALVRQLLKDAYTFLDDNNKPKIYQTGIQLDVDEKLAEIGKPPEGATWWEIVDFLFDKELHLLAEKAQRHAVPTIKDVIEQINISKTVKNSYSTVYYSEKELLTEYARRMLIQSIDALPILSKPTRLDVEGSNFRILDLNNVAKGSSASGKKQAGIFYLLARFIVAKGFFLHKEMLKECPPKYFEYHKLRVQRAKATPKLLIFDEFHRVSHLRVIMEQILEDMREGRKWNLSIMMASQLLRDIPSSMTELLSSVLLLSSSIGSQSEIVKRFSSFGINRHLLDFFTAKCVGPDGANGTPLLAFVKLKKRFIAQSFRFILSPYMYWVTSSDGVDSDFKDYVVDRIGAKKAIYVLSKAFPYGVRNELQDAAEHVDESVRENPFEHLLKRVLEIEQPLH